MERRRRPRRLYPSGTLAPATNPTVPTLRGSELLAAGVVAAGLGWVLENVYAGPRYSVALGGERAGVPLLPVYGAGGVLVLTMAPHLAGRPWYVRFAAYAGALTMLEYAACQLDRASGSLSWAYGADGACVDAPHTIAWGLLGLGAEKLAANTLG